MASGRNRGGDTSARIFGSSSSDSNAVRVTAAPSNEGNVRVTIIPSSNDANNPYTIVTYTGKNWYAGTDANVFITLYGAKGVSEDIELAKSKDHGNPFESGQKDTFYVKAKDLGFVYKIQIHHDNTGSFPGWLLNKVVVIDNSSNRKYIFPCNDWLFKGKGYEQLVHELEVNELPVIGIDPLHKENSISHHTDKFKTDSNPCTILLRRGQTFKVIVKLAREYIPSQDSFYFTLKTGERPRDKDKTLITIAEVLPKDFKSKMTSGQWCYTMRGSEDPNNVLVEIFIPPTALPAKYEVLVDTDDGTAYEPKAPLYVLFNPWCKDDEVFMEDEEERREYVLRQHGSIYVGNWKRPRPRSWYFGQFEEVCLEAAFQLLDGVKASGRDTAVEVTRIVSSKVNSIDNNGILEGNWSGDYESGKPPNFWKSTPVILENYVADSLPVKFGQCWVFSAIVTTIMRALGIPCRPVTNFSSAHDSDGSCTNDTYLDEDGEEISDLSSDSVWNFHVWNDAWMARNDLKPGYGGWQAVDATPQERSQGLFQMGPASHRAIKEGEINLPYDTGFVLAEVNADTIYWQKNDDGVWEVIYRNRTKVGKKMSTKDVGRPFRHDVTDDYKFAEGSILERAAVRNALIKAKSPAVKTTRKDIEMELLPDKEEVIVGEDISFTLKLTNSSSEDLALTSVLGGYVVRYDGVAKARLAKDKERITIKANSETAKGIIISAKDYLSYLEDDTMIRFFGMASVHKTGQIVRCEEIIDLVKPDLNMDKVPKKFKSGVEKEFWVSFRNPMNKPLTRCEMYIDGTIIAKRIFIKSIKDVKTEEEFRQKVSIKPDPVDGFAKRSIIVSFSCKELGGISGSTKVDVTD